MSTPRKASKAKWNYELRAVGQDPPQECLLDKGETSIEPDSLAGVYLGEFLKLLPAKTPFQRLHVVVKDQAGKTVLDKAVDETGLPGQA